MDHVDLKSLIERANTRRYDLIVAKGNDYSAGSKDALIEFKIAAEEAGVEPVQSCHILLTKQLRAIARYVREGRIDTEGIESRLDDARNYLDILEALIVEAETSPLPPVSPPDSGRPEERRWVPQLEPAGGIVVPMEWFSDSLQRPRSLTAQSRSCRT